MRERVGKGPGAEGAGGFALLAVLLVLLALLVVATPFLSSVRNSDRTSARAADRAQARLALDAAARHARGVLGQTHGGLDATPDYDGPAELAVDNRFPEAFLDASNPEGVMWDLEVSDQAGLIDLASASPHTFANMMGASTYLTRHVSGEDGELPVGLTRGFDPEGFLWVDGELIAYARRELRSFTDLQRGLLVRLNADENPEACGPRPAASRAPGMAVLDQRAVALADWRLGTGEELRPYDSPQQLYEAGEYALAGAIGPEAVASVASLGTAWGGVHAGRVWQRPTRVRNGLVGGTDCVLIVDQGRFFNAGTTVRISDGQGSEVALVRDVPSIGRVRLTEPVRRTYLPFETTIEALARRPVNLNSAPPEVLEALFENLRVRGRNSRITQNQAAGLTSLVLAARPLRDMQDLVERVLFPAAGLEEEVRVEEPEEGVDEEPTVIGPAPTAILDPADAWAVYLNGQNANDAYLTFATMPFAFSSREVFAFDLRASVNAKSGIERAALRREQVELVVPQRELLALWSRQIDFDRSLRLDRQAPYWASGPAATSRDDGFGTTPPSRDPAHLGSRLLRALVTDPSDLRPFEPVFPATDAGWVRLWPMRLEESGLRQGRAMHFDREITDPEGRRLVEEAVRLPTDDERVEWADPDQLLRPFEVSFWIKPSGLAEGDHLFDLGGDDPQRDRVRLYVESGELVLSVLDGAGNHPATQLAEAGEVRVGLERLPADTWTHLSLDVRGNRPHQMNLFVDGAQRGRTRGSTTLVAPLPFNQKRIQVESTAGFPTPCVLRIGNELIEATILDGETFLAEYHVQGALAGFGGRQAREPFVLEDSNNDGVVERINLGLEQDVDHQTGSLVELYGYSLPTDADIGLEEGRLVENLGVFAAARLVGTEGGATPRGDPILIQTLDGPVSVGWGLEGASSNVDVLELAPADGDRALQVGGLGPDDFMDAFDPGGGFAAIVQRVGSFEYQGSGGNETRGETANGTPLGGVEVVRYRGVDKAGRRLLLEAPRSRFVAQLSRLAGGPSGPNDPVGGDRAFLVTYGGNVQNASEYNEDLRWLPVVVPISFAAGAGVTLPTHPDESSFVQLTPPANAAERTEWVRYDDVWGSRGEVVRSDPDALERMLRVLSGATLGIPAPPVQLPGPGPGPGPGPFVPGGGGSPKVSSERSVPLVQDEGLSPHWSYEIGAAEDETLALSRSLASRLQFRGVMGTFSHSHTAGEVVVPAFQVLSAPLVDGGWAGARDPIFGIDQDELDLGWPGEVRHAFRVLDFELRYEWEPAANNALVPLFEGESLAPVDPFLEGRTYVATSGSLGTILPRSNWTANRPPVESRTVTRLSKFPSGELPRLVRDLVLGGERRSGAGLPDAVVDEVLFGATTQGGPGLGRAGLGGLLVTTAELAVGGDELFCDPTAVRLAIGARGTATSSLTGLSEDAGLLRVGDEILAYSSVNRQTGTLQLAAAGRGLLGTEVRHHEPGEPVVFLAGWPVSVLDGDVGPEDSRLPINAPDDFPDQGTVLVDDELLHYTRRRASGLEMPRSASAPGLRDEQGAGIFRGRYGTIPANHAFDTPVILFPFRYWDRWEDEVEAPELAYHGLAVDQPGAFWRGYFWEQESALDAAVRLGVLVRSDPTVPWDADPDRTEGLDRTYLGALDGERHPLNLQSDQLEVRVFASYEPGAFEPRDGLAHGWKRSPALSLFGVEYVAPSRVLWRLDR